MLISIILNLPHANIYTRIMRTTFHFFDIINLNSKFNIGLILMGLLFECSLALELICFDEKMLFYIQLKTEMEFHHLDRVFIQFIHSFTNKMFSHENGK